MLDFAVEGFGGKKGLGCKVSEPRPVDAYEDLRCLMMHLPEKITDLLVSRWKHY